MGQVSGGDKLVVDDVAEVASTGHHLWDTRGFMKVAGGGHHLWVGLGVGSGILRARSWGPHR